MGRWSTLKDFKELQDKAYTLVDISKYIYSLVKRCPNKLLPLLINHEWLYVRWAVKRRLENKEFSVSTYNGVP